MMKYLLIYANPAVKSSLLAFVLVMLTLLGCASAPIQVPLGQPTCSALIPVTDEIWNDLGQLRETMSHNQLADKKCIKLLRARIDAYDSSLK